MLRFGIHIDGEPRRQARSLVVLQAEDFLEAKRRALELGHIRESRYSNAEEEGVLWQFEEIETLDLLGDTITDGREVHAEFLASRDWGNGQPPATPEASEPTQSGV
jgi:hypothetical protein